MKTIILKKQGDFDEWRTKARLLLQEEMRPEDVFWHYHLAPTLFDGEPASPPSEKYLPAQRGQEFRVPKQFINLAKNVICHESEDSAALLYRLLYRLQQDKTVLEKIYDIDTATALSRQKAVCHDIHHMHAFLRFKEIDSLGDDTFRRCFTAWYEPQHFIIAEAIPFFCRRFSDMDWQILTPKGSAFYFNKRLFFGEPIFKKPQNKDETEELWKTYFASIFNPARLKLKTMQSHMPKKYWSNLPEAEIINSLVDNAETRIETMERQPVLKPPLFHSRLAERNAGNVMRTSLKSQATLGTLNDLDNAIKSCKRCPLHCSATQAVCGEGPENASLMIIGEQPGDREDLVGRPFIGPAGQIFEKTIEKIGIERDKVYITNAVKHFKYELKGRKRLHKRADRSEVEHCRWWLMKEIDIVKPKLIVAMGKTALFSLTDLNEPLSGLVGKIIETEEKIPVLVTFHPSYLLRIESEELKKQEAARFEHSLQLAKVKNQLLTGQKNTI
ncbi:UdgX family uracil-DNA binding protein [Bartonella sp. M0177]|uniref:UdgX family uracil-DNA binding protein n=1 Tax=Bartonella sp. M0177 TaxID=2750940 RepID=UPI0018DCFA42|nr:UdgX family uracil-DNA binding protein [Bartonella sp. M0177]MBI0003050.1 UdgX family uracil-DNA binding protein [Bartonella sp. M0177]